MQSEPANRFAFLFFQGALWRVPLESFSAQAVFVSCAVMSPRQARSLLAHTKTRFRLQKDIAPPAGAKISHNIFKQLKINLFFEANALIQQNNLYPPFIPYQYLY